MSSAVANITPFNEPSRPRRLRTVAGWLVGIALVVVLLNVVGVDVTGWISELWDTLTAISFASIFAGISLSTLQTSLTALAWYYILVEAWPEAGLRYRSVLAAYAAGVAMNGFLPANIGTFVTLLMFAALISGATFGGILGAAVVEKIFFTIAGTFVYLYLFLSVPGSFDIELGNLGDHWVLALLSLVGLVFLIVLLVRAFKRKARQLWANAKQGGAILAKPRRFLLRVVLPSFIAWICTISITGVFLNAYGIPVTFHTIMSVMGGNSLANTVTATPGGIGITQAVNAASLSDVTDTATATAYSIGQQLIISAWHVVFATIVVVWAFGWSGGKTLVADSYGDAKVKVAEQKAARAERKAAKRKDGEGLLHSFRHNGDRKDDQA
jgi:uncharacterized membrane protein YbhN (UPF0104 family)